MGERRMTRDEKHAASAAKACPCGGLVKVFPPYDDHPALVVCDDCGREGAAQQTVAQAVAVWNAMERGRPGDLRATLLCGECGQQFKHTFPNETFGEIVQVGRVVVFPHKPCYEAYMRKTMFTTIDPATPVEPMTPDRFICRVVATQRPHKGDWEE